MRRLANTATTLAGLGLAALLLMETLWRHAVNDRTACKCGCGIPMEG